jgi:hypothetical protein
MGERTIYKLAKQGDIPSFKVSNQWWFLRNHIESSVEQKKSEVMGKTEKPLKDNNQKMANNNKGISEQALI